MDVDTGQLLGVAIGGGIAAGASWLTTRSGAKAARELAREERDAGRAAARDSFVVDSLLEMQVATVHLLRAFTAYRGAMQDWIADGLDPSEVAPEERYSRLIESMAHVQMLGIRLEDRPGVGAAMALRDCASNLLTYELAPTIDESHAAVDHILDEGVHQGVEALDSLGRHLASLPAPTTYRPLAPWSVRPPD